MSQRIEIPQFLQIKDIKLLPIDLKCKIMDYRMGLALIICYLHPRIIITTICNTIMNIITLISMVTFQHQTTHHFQHLLHLLSHQQMMKDVNYLVQYMRRSSIKIYITLYQYLLGVQVM